MYNHLLMVDIDGKRYEAIIESMPSHDPIMLVWIDDFSFPSNLVEMIQNQMTQWFADQHIALIFMDGHGR